MTKASFGSEFLDQLDTLIDFMRERGAYRLKNGDFELELMLDFTPPVANQPEPEAKSGEAEVQNAPKVGKDGLTAEQQQEIYGRVLSDTR